MANKTGTIIHDEAKVKENAAIIKNRYKKLEHSLDELTCTLTKHINSLDKHSIVMENLNRAIKQFDTTIKKETRLESHHPSLQLKEAITSFVKYNINPRYYQDAEYLKLKAAAATMPAEFISKTA